MEWQKAKHLPLFGSIGHVHVSDGQRTKLDAKSEKLIFIIYGNNSKGYKLYNPNNRKIVISWDEIFYEEGEWDFGSHLDDSNFFPLQENEQIIKEEARKEQQEPTNPLTSSALTTHEDSPPWFLEEKDVARMRSLQDLYKEIERFDSLTLFYLFGNCESVNFQEVVQDESWDK